MTVLTLPCSSPFRNCRSTMGAPQRRTIYTASLEAHVDRLHEQLLSLELFPVPFQTLECFKGLNSKTAKVGVIQNHARRKC